MLASQIYDGTLPDELPISRDEMAEVLGYKHPGSLYVAINKGLIPEPADKLGFCGQARWFVGQLRAWNKDKMKTILVRDAKRKRELSKGFH